MSRQALPICFQFIIYESSLIRTQLGLYRCNHCLWAVLLEMVLFHKHAALSQLRSLQAFNLTMHATLNNNNLLSPKSGPGSQSLFAQLQHAHKPAPQMLDSVNDVFPQDDFTLGKKIATGGFGTVYSADLDDGTTPGGRPVIIKKVTFPGWHSTKKSEPAWQTTEKP